jgi:integrase/recombinase XerD
MDQYLHKFLEALAAHKGYSENTIAAYRNDIGQFTRFVRDRRGAPIEPTEVTPEIVEAYVQNLQHGPEGYAPSTVARKIAAVKSFFHFLTEEKVIPADPAAKLNSPKVKKHVPKTLSQAEIERLLAAPGRAGGPKGIRDRALLELLCATGMRVTEVVNLRLGDVDWDQGLVVCRGKGERQRRIPLGTAQAALNEYAEGARASLAKPDSPPVLFLNHRGQKLTRQGVWLILKEAAEAAGVGADVTPHTLRHSFARYLVGAGEDLRRVQELLGHANLSTTQVYRQVGDDAHAEADAGQPRSLRVDSSGELRGQPAPKGETG